MISIEIERRDGNRVPQFFIVFGVIILLLTAISYLEGSHWFRVYMGTTLLGMVSSLIRRYVRSIRILGSGLKFLVMVSVVFGPLFMIRPDPDDILLVFLVVALSLMMLVLGMTLTAIICQSEERNENIG